MRATPLEYLISAIAPLECHICGTEKFMLCQACIETVVPELESRCYICNKLSEFNVVCRSCGSKSKLRRVWWLGKYESTLKELIFELKFNRKRTYGYEFGQHLANTLPFIPEDTLVIPLPTASSRVRRRGFDQAVMIARGFSKQRNLQMATNLKRTSQADQIGKRRSDRLKQMQTSFTVTNPDSLINKNILLIDDVLTTGASLESAARLLRLNGAKHVDAAVIARHLLS